MKKKRTEKDFLGTLELPYNAYYGINSMRGHDNFFVSEDKTDSTLIKTIAWVKRSCALANLKCKIIDKKIADAIVNACDLISKGYYHDQFIVNSIQGGGGTSINMAANEIIANIALEALGHNKGEYAIIDPLNHVNMSQSTNDIFPTAINLALILKLKSFINVLNEIKETLVSKSIETSSITKMGRTHLNAASPITFGQCFNAYLSMFIRDHDRINQAQDSLLYIPLGGTVIGTGINTSPQYKSYVIEYLRQVSGINVEVCSNLADGIQNVDVYTALSSALKICILNLSKVASDLRLLGSDPQYGIGEIHLPPRQMGSSIIPDKINPVMAELINQISFIVCGYDLTINMAAQAGQLELNVYKPTISYCLFKSIDLMTEAIKLFDQYCLQGMKVVEKT